MIFGGDKYFEKRVWYVIEKGIEKENNILFIELRWVFIFIRWWAFFFRAVDVKIWNFGLLSVGWVGDFYKGCFFGVLEELIYFML